MTQLLIKEDYRLLSERDFHDVRCSLIHHLKSKFGLSVNRKKIVDKECYLGSFDGESLNIKSDLSVEHSTFMIAHLFGHTAQWCGSNRDRYSFIESSPSFTSARELSNWDFERLRFYENEAAAYAIRLLEDVFGKALNQWYSDWAVADWDYFTGLTSLDRPSEAIDVKFGRRRIRAKALPVINLHPIPTMYAY